MTERVLVAPREALHPEPWPQGFVPLDDAQAQGWQRAIAAHGFFAPRARAEEEPAWKQPIPYCVLRLDGCVFVTERLTGGGEARLHGRLSAGIGGHVGPEDGEPGDAELLQRALGRELDEELARPVEGPQPRLVGLINDDSNPVGRVHVGFAYLLDLSTTPHAQGAWKNLKVAETTVLRGHWAPLAGSESLWQDLQRFESWSQILLEGLWRPWQRKLEAPASDPSITRRNSKEARNPDVPTPNSQADA